MNEQFIEGLLGIGVLKIREVIEKHLFTIRRETKAKKEVASIKLMVINELLVPPTEKKANWVY